MSLAFRHFTVYLRVLLILVVGGGVAILLFANRSNSVPFWFFRLRDAKEPLNVVWLMSGTAVGTLLAWWALSFAWGLVRDWKELQRLKAAKEAEQVQRSRTVELEQRERRVSEAERDLGSAKGTASDEPVPDEDDEDS